MAWAIGRGHRRVPTVLVLFFGLNVFGLVNGLVQGSAVYARPDLAIGIVHTPGPQASSSTLPVGRKASSASATSSPPGRSRPPSR